MTQTEPRGANTGSVGSNLASGFEPALVSLAGMGAELRRRWRLVTVTTIVGAVLAVALVMVTGGGATASTTIILGHDPSTDPTRAIQTDLRLIQTRVVAERVVADQGLDMSADDLLSMVEVSAPSSELITIRAAAADANRAVDVASGLAAAYLSFRSEVLTQEAEAVAQGNEELVDSLSLQVEEITREVEELSGSNSDQSGARLNEIVALRADLTSQIDRIRQSIRAEQIALAAVIGSSRVVDPAVADPTPGSLGAVLTLGTGLVGGLAAGVAIVVGYAILSDRPRRRSAISQAISAPIVLSVGRVRGRRRSSRQARKIVSARLTDWVIERRWGTSRLAVLSAGSEKEAQVVAATLLRAIGERGVPVTAIDLTVAGGLDRKVGVKSVTLDEWASETRRGQPSGTIVVRPGDVPDIHRPPASLAIRPGHSGNGSGTDSLMIVVGQVSAALGAEHLAAWAGTALLVLKAGGASSEQLTGAARVVRGDGMRLVGAVLTATDRADVSVGEQYAEESGHLERTSAVAR